VENEQAPNGAKDKFSRIRSGRAMKG